MENIKKTFKNAEIKNTEGYQLFVLYNVGCLLLLSITENIINFYDFGKILNTGIPSMAKTHNNKS